MEHVGFRSPVPATDPATFLPGFGVMQCARRKPQSKQQAIRLGAAPYEAPPPHNPGLHKPLSFAGNFRVEAPLTAAEEGQLPNPYTSFDAVNGPIVLAGTAEWTTDMYITHAMAAANLPGTPIARFLRHELVDFPGPQIAITQDHGPLRLKAVVCDFRPLKGKVEVIDAALTASVLDMVQTSRSLPDPSHALHIVTGISCTTLINGIIAPPAQIMPPDADLVMFQIWRDGTPVDIWRRFVLGDARPPVPPVPHDAAHRPVLPAQRAQVSYTGASSSQPAAIPRYAPAQRPAPESRYSDLDTFEV